jgi:hypothetical protein
LTRAVSRRCGTRYFRPEDVGRSSHGAIIGRQTVSRWQARRDRSVDAQQIRQSA